MKRLAVVLVLSVSACAAQPGYPPPTAGIFAPPGCMYPTFSLTYVCPEKDRQAKEAAEAAQREQQKQALIAQIGLPAYQEQQRKAAAEQAGRTWTTMFNLCEQQMPIPVTAFQDQWMRNHCDEYADSFVH